MTIKSKISYFASSIFTLLFGIACIVVFLVFSNFRKNEFRDRLSEKAFTTIKLLTEVKEVDNTLLKIIDKNAINELYNEKTLVFDSAFNLIYSSLDDTQINWTVDDLKYLKENKTFFKRDGEYEIYGVFYDSKSKDYFALISANDSYGKRKLRFLGYLLLISYAVFTVAIWFVIFYVVRGQFAALESFQRAIRTINDLKTINMVSANPNSNNEIDVLGNEFNQMMNRVVEVYEKQKEFVSQASHELRTPLARISAQIENKIQSSNDADAQLLTTLLHDVDQLTGLIHSLLLLSKVDNAVSADNETVRLDEAVYNAIDFVSKLNKDLAVSLEMKPFDNMETKLNIAMNPQLLEIAIMNLLKNAYLYSDNKTVQLLITEIDNRVVLRMANTGNILKEEEQKKLFQPFMRGENAKNIQGFGLGLRIVHRIFTAYGHQVAYTAAPNENIFTIYFK